VNRYFDQLMMDKIQNQEFINMTLLSSTFREKCLGMYGRIILANYFSEMYYEYMNWFERVQHRFAL
jgi:hypothetical protein